MYKSNQKENDKDNFLMSVGEKKIKSFPSNFACIWLFLKVGENNAWNTKKALEVSFIKVDKNKTNVCLEISSGSMGKYLK